jgi:hypothetical protein
MPSAFQPHIAHKLLMLCEIAGILAPEDGGRISLDLGEERLDVRGWTDAVVAVPVQVAVAPVELPDAARANVAEPGDREPGPVRADLGCPGRSALDDRDRPTRHLELDPDLVAQASWDAAVAVAPDPGEVEIGQDGLGGGHGAQD